MSQTFVPLANPKKSVLLSRFLTSTAFVSASLASNNLYAKAAETTELPTVSVIESNSSESYNSTESSYYKLNGPLVNTPKTVSTVTRQLMDDQGVTTVSGALRNVPGVSLAAGEASSQGDNISIRGFSARNDYFIDGMRDFGSYYRDSFNLETIEVVQGPSSALFGRGSTGGAVQQNSKQAFLGTKNEGTLMLGTNETTRGTADVNTKIGENSAFRLNVMGNRNKVAERDETLNRRAGFAPSLAFGLGTDTRLNISHLYQVEDDIPDYGIPFFKGEPANTDRSNYYGFKNNDHLKTNVNISTVKFEHDLSDSSTLRNQTRYARYFRDVQVTEPQMTTNGGTVTRSIKARNSVESYMGNQTDISSKFSTLGLDHNAIFGIAVESESSTPTAISYSGVPSTTLQNPDGTIPFSYSVNASSSTYTKTKLDTVAAYVADTIKIGKSWELSLGSRFDKLQTSYDSVTFAGARTILTRKDNLVSYNAGLVYKPAENGSIYVSHGTSFNPSAESLSLSTSTTSVAPEKNTVYEMGTKWDLLKKRLSTTLAVFRADKDNARENTGLTSNTLSGSQRVYGVQAQVTGKITDKLQLIVGYAYLDGRITKSLISPDYKNRALANTPQNSFNVFATYKMTPKLEIGGGGNYISERYVTGTSAADPVTGTVRKIPGYVTFNAMAKYPVTKNIDLQLNINNITNKYYFDQLRGAQAAVPGEGRVVLLTTKVKF